MAETTTTKNKNPDPLVILITYIVLGSLVSFVFGREPGADLPPNIHREMAPVVLVVASFLISYSVWDVMAVGISKSQAHYLEKSYKDLPSQMPEPVYLAVRVQTNQVEQMPGFIVGALLCGLLVNGRVAAVLAMMWAILRRRYATVYRAALGVPLKDMGLSRFTIPSYFLSNTMLMASAVQALRCIVSTTA